MSQETTIAVFGSSRPRPGSNAYDLAYRVGQEIAKRGWRLCNGGYGGTMEASAKGAKDAGGTVLGVTCSVWNRSGINAFLDREICTDDLYGRIRTLVELSSGYIALPGGTGTLLELALVWELVNKKFLKATPIVLVGDFWQPIADIVSQDDPRCTGCIQRATGPAEAMEQIERCQ